MFFLVRPLIGPTVLVVGRIEDVAAKRSPRLWPNGVRRGEGRRGRREDGR